MRAWSALYRRQVAAYFYAPMAYVVMSVFWCVAGLNFFRLLDQSLEERLRVGDLLFGSLFFWVTTLAAIAVSTMHLLAEEKRAGTLEALLTAPVTDTEVVLAKYAGALTFFGALCAPLLTYLGWVRLCALEPLAVDGSAVVAGYGMFFLIVAFYLAFGLWISSLTRSQVTAAMLCFGGTSVLFFVDNLSYVARGDRIEAWLDAVSAVRHLLDFSQGIVDTRPLVFYVSAIAWLLFAAVKSLEARHWK